MQGDNKRTKVKKGYLVVRVGLTAAAATGGGVGGFQRFVIPIAYLSNPLFKSLLESAEEAYGYSSSGPLKLPGTADDFLHLLRRIEHGSERGSHGRRRGCYVLSGAHGRVSGEAEEAGETSRVLVACIRWHCFTSAP